MAEEKKPKIDLKARLGKSGPQNVPVPTPPPGLVAPVASSEAAASSASPSRVPIPPGVAPPPAFDKSGVPLDPSNPLVAAVAAPYRAATPAPPPPPQRIIVDDAAVHEARRGARKQALLAAAVAALGFGIVGYVWGSSHETSNARQISVNNARDLATKVIHARTDLQKLSDTVEAGRNSLLKDKKFPATLAHDLGAINVDFDGSKLAGVRFSGFSIDTSTSLIEFITSVQAVNDRKNAVVSLLTRLQKPITEQLAAGQKATISYVVLLGGPRDASNNAVAVLAPLAKAIEVPNPAQQVALPKEFEAVNPLTKETVSAPKYAAGGLDKPAALYVAPKSIEAAFPSETSGQIAQLGSQLARLVADIHGEQGGDAVSGSKGLLERADRLAEGLNRVQ
ncbi:MAG: hypothetical protein FWD69_01090 [Polyangiaceae bacterium]|nr:hypothetical protein [Polyangiaceae bacterium]